MAMTAEELQQLKDLTAKFKEGKKEAGALKDTLFEKVIGTFGAKIASVKKDIVTITTKEAYSDGNVWAITVGIENDDAEEANTSELAVEVMEDVIADVEAVLGLGSSVKVAGTYEGQKMSVQFRKRAVAE